MPLRFNLVFALALLLGGALSFSSCKPPKTQWEGSSRLPDGVLDQPAMIRLLVDIHLAEGDLLERNLSAEEHLPFLQRHYGQILASHGISAKQLQDSYQFYVERPLTLNTMYNEVVEQLNRMQAAVEAEGQENKARIDSL